MKISLVLFILQFLFAVMRASATESDQAQKTIYHQKEIPGKCLLAYELGKTAYADVVAQNIKDDWRYQNYYYNNPRATLEYARRILLNEHWELAEAKMQSVNIELSSELGRALTEEEIITPNKCRLYFDLGIFDVEALTQQNLVIEYLLDQQHINFYHNLTTSNDKLNQIKQLVRKRYEELFTHFLLPPDATDRFALDSDFGKKVLPPFIEFMKKKASEADHPISFGRFLWVDGYDTTFTSFNYSYERNPRDPRTYYVPRDYSHQATTQGRRGKLKIVPGTYQIAASRLYQLASHTLSRYIQWQPDLVFGDDISPLEETFVEDIPYIGQKLIQHTRILSEDSWLLGAYSGEQTIREIKEAGYANMIEFYHHMGVRLKLKGENLAPLTEAASHFMNAQVSRIANDIQRLDVLASGVKAAPFIPLSFPLAGYGAMALFGSGTRLTLSLEALSAGWQGARTTLLTLRGLKTLMSVQLGVRSWEAANAANSIWKTGALMTALSMATAASYGGYVLYQRLQQNPNENLTTGLFLEQVMGATIASFPLILTTNLVIGVSGGPVNTLLTSARNGFVMALEGVSTIRQFGFIASMRNLGLVTKEYLFHVFEEGLSNQVILMMQSYFINGTMWTVFAVGGKELRINNNASVISLEHWFGHRGENPLGLSPFFLRDEQGQRLLLDYWGYDKDTLVTLASIWILNIFFAPIMTVEKVPVVVDGVKTYQATLPNAWVHRYWLNRLVGLVGYPTIGLIVNGEMDPKRFSFDLAFGASFSVAMSEGVRKMMYGGFFSKMLNGQKMIQKKPVFMLLTLASCFAQATLKEYLIKALLSANAIQIEQFKSQIRENNLEFMIAELTDDEIIQQFNEFKNNVDDKFWEMARMSKRVDNLNLPLLPGENPPLDYWENGQYDDEEDQFELPLIDRPFPF